MLHSPPPSTELGLALAWQSSGDQAALQQLIAPLFPRIQRLGRRLSAPQAEDLAAEGVIALIEAIGRWPGESHGNLTGFVWPAVQGAMLSARSRSLTAVAVPERRLRDGLSGRSGTEAQQALSLLIDSESFDEQLSPAAAPASEDLALRAERGRIRRQALARALWRLSRTERHLVIRHLLQEAGGLEGIARALQLSPERARSLEGRALHKMRNNLMRDGFLKSDLL